MDVNPFIQLFVRWWLSLIYLVACPQIIVSIYIVDFVKFSWDGKPYTSNIKWRSTIAINGFNNRNHKKGAIFYWDVNGLRLQLDTVSTFDCTSGSFEMFFCPVTFTDRTLREGFPTSSLWLMYSRVIHGIAPERQVCKRTHSNPAQIICIAGRFRIMGCSTKHSHHAKFKVDN